MTKTKSLEIMTHVVLGYPDIPTSQQLIRSMVAEGVSHIEIQFPFSDPLGDGSTIMRANHHVLKNGLSTARCFELLREIRSEIPIPIYLMTYANIPFRFGIQRFFQRAKALNFAGCIIPDIPYDEEEHSQLDSCAEVPLIPVISANTDKKRLKHIAAHCRSMLYCTLHVGITGTSKAWTAQKLQYLRNLRTYSQVPLIGGFGISSRTQLLRLRGLVDIAVIGSHIIRILDEKGIQGVRSFLQSLLLNTM